MGTTNPILAGLGSATKAAGAVNASSAQRSSLQYQSSIAASNAILAQDRASIAENTGQIESQNQGLKTAQIYGMQRANLAANGVDLGSGSASDILTSTKLMGARDTAQIQTNAMRDAWGYSTQAADLSSNAAALKSMAGGVNPLSAGVTSLMGSAPQLSTAWKTYNTATNGDGS